MKITVEQVQEFWAMEPFMVARVEWYEDTGSFEVSVLATNIGSDSGLTELIDGLAEEVNQAIDELANGVSTYLFHMRWVSAGYSRMGDSIAYPYEPYWTIADYELISTETDEAQP